MNVCKVASRIRLQRTRWIRRRSRDESKDESKDERKDERKDL